VQIFRNNFLIVNFLPWLSYILHTVAGKIVAIRDKVNPRNTMFMDRFG